MTTTYLLRGIPPALAKQVEAKLKATVPAVTIRGVLLALLEEWINR